MPKRVACVAAPALGAVLLLLAAGSWVALAMLPVLLLAAVLVAGMYPGEEVIERLAARRRGRLQRRRVARLTRWTPTTRVAVAGRLLVLRAPDRGPPACAV